MDPTASEGGAAAERRTGDEELSPVVFSKPIGAEGRAMPEPDVEVGAFRRGTATSRWALARYLVGRSIIEAVGTSMLVIAVVFLALAALCQWGLHQTAAAVLALIFGLIVLLVRAASLGILRRLTAVRRYGPIEDRMNALVKDTRSDVLRELRRLGLPGRAITLPWLAVRLLGPRRKDTLVRLRGFDVDRAVPPARVDELHVLWGDAFGPGQTAFAPDSDGGPGRTPPR